MSSSRDQNFELIQLFAGNRSGGRGGVFDGQLLEKINSLRGKRKRGIDRQEIFKSFLLLQL